jgi:uncharacterized membrane protein (DUF373 family)
MPESNEEKSEGWVVRHSSDLFHHMEHAAYVAVGVLLCAGAILALGGAVVAVWGGLGDWTSTKAILSVIDRLLFVLLLVEILHTIRASLRSGGLTCEPFLIVGLIACIRRVLVITLQTSEATKPGEVSPDMLAVLRESMVELSVLGVLVLILVGSLFLLSRMERVDTNR